MACWPEERIVFDGAEKCVVAKNTFLHVYPKHMEAAHRSARRNSAPNLAWRFSFSSSSSSDDDDADENLCATSLNTQVRSDSDTTLMMKNIPCSCKRDEVVRVLEESGFIAACNFFYLPTRKDKIIGYAFIGFADVEVAEEFTQKMSGYRFADRKSDKILSVVPACIQGLNSNIEHFKKSSVMRKKEKKPKFFDRGR